MDRGYIEFPYASIRTDAGKEFQNHFNKYLYENSIIHKVGLPGRHSQSANIEALNKSILFILVNYMNTQEKKRVKSLKNGMTLKY